MIVYTDIAVAVKQAIINPGEIVLVEKSALSDTYVAIYAIKTCFKNESYQIYIDNYYHVNASVSEDYIEGGFKCEGVYLAADNTIYNAGFFIKYERAEEISKKFIIGDDFKKVVRDLNEMICIKLIETYIEPNDDLKTFRDAYPEIVFTSDDLKSYPDKPFDFKFYERNAFHPDGFYVMDFDNFLEYSVNKMHYTFDEAIDVLLDYKKIDDRIRQLLSNADVAECIAQDLVSIRHCVNQFNAYFADKNSEYNKRLEISRALVNKESVLVTFSNFANETFEVKVPCRAFDFDEGYISEFALTNKQRDELDAFRDKHSSPQFNEILNIKYRGKQIYSKE